MGSRGDLTRFPKAIVVARGLASRGQSNSSVGSLNLHDWCFGLAQRPPSLYGATEGSANEAADVRLESFGLSRGLSAAAESAFPKEAIASILRDASGGKRLRADVGLCAEWPFEVSRSAELGPKPQGRTFFSGLI